MSALVAAPYPTYREADVVLRDGSTVHVRPVRPADKPALATFFQGLSDESRVLRFFSAATNVASVAARESQVDYCRTFALVATAGPDRRLIGHAYYATVRPGRAEVALAIADSWQGRGLGTLLLGQLAEVAAASGIEAFEADVLPSNHRMLEVFRESGFALQSRPTPDAIRMILPTALEPAALERFDRREQLAAATAQAARAMADRLAAGGHPPSGFLVQPMVPPGVELLVGVVHDDRFGPVVACGAGGTLVELLKDVSVRLAPLGWTDAAEMLRELKSYPLLTGFRGAPARDVAAVEDLLLRAATLADDFPEIAELDCNPVVVSEHGAVIVDAGVRVQPATPPRPLGARS